MKVLLLAAESAPTQALIERAKAALPPDSAGDVQLLSLHAPRKKLPVASHWVIEPSAVPYRPIRQVPTRRRKRVPAPSRRRRIFERGFEVWQGLSSRVPTVTALRLSNQSRFAIACSTSRSIHRLARQADVIVALDNEALYGAWLLSRRIPGVIVVNRPGSVAGVLGARSAENG